MGRKGKSLLGGGRLSLNSVTVSARCETTGRSATVVGRGVTKTAATRDAIAQIEAHPADWRVVCISDPQTIYDDLRGRPIHPGHTERPILPEFQMLSRIGRRDLAPLTIWEHHVNLPRARRRTEWDDAA